MKNNIQTYHKINTQTIYKYLFFYMYDIIYHTCKKIDTLNSIRSFHKHFLLLMLKAVQLPHICAPVLYILFMIPPIVSNLLAMGRCKPGLTLKRISWKEIAKEQMSFLSANTTEQINILCYFWVVLYFSIIPLLC